MRREIKAMKVGLLKKALFLINKAKFPLIILLIALLLRTFWLDKFPIGITNDELHFVLNAKAVYLQGSNLAGNWHPLSFKTIPGESSSELTFAVIAPILGLLDLSLFVARLPFAILSTLTVLVIYLISKRFFAARIAFVVGLVAAFNPWSIYVGRTSFDATMAVFFYMVALYFLLIFKGWKILLAFVPFLMAFYTYIGTKVIFLPFALITIFFSWFFLNRRDSLKPFLLLLGFCLIIFSNYIFSLGSQNSGARLSELATLNDIKIINQVEEERRLSIQSPLEGLLSNKITVYSRNFFTKYINNFSTDLLFLQGDKTYKVSLWEHGYFYYLDFLFLLIGFVFLYTKNKKFWLLLVTLVAIAPLPEVVRSDKMPAYALHSALLYPLLTIFIGIGLWSVVSFIRDKRYRYFLIIVVTVLYLIQVVNFYNIYFLRYPIYHSEAFDFSFRVISKYAFLETQKNREVYIFSVEPSTIFKNYLFYTNAYNSQTAQTISNLYKGDASKGIKYGNLNFVPSSYEFSATDKSTIIVHNNIGDPRYKDSSNRLLVPRLSGGGEVFLIANSETCKNLNLGYDPYDIKIGDMDIEKLDEATFCQKFITKSR